MRGPFEVRPTKTPERESAREETRDGHLCLLLALSHGAVACEWVHSSAMSGAGPSPASEAVLGRHSRRSGGTRRQSPCALNYQRVGQWLVHHALPASLCSLCADCSSCALRAGPRSGTSGSGGHGRRNRAQMAALVHVLPLSGRSDSCMMPCDIAELMSRNIYY